MRPAGTAPRFASDDLYDSPGKPWDNTDTKRAPSAGIMTQGRVPGTKAVPQHENYVHDELRKYTIYQDTLESQNWGRPHVFTISSGWVPTLVGTWTASERRFFFGAEAAVFSSGRGDADTWTAETIPGSGPPTLKFMVGNSFVVTGGGSYQGFMTYVSGTWALVPVAGFTFHCATQWNPSISGFRFMLGAENAGHAPVVVSLATNMTTATVHSMAGGVPSGYTNAAITHFISCETNALSIAVAIAGGDGTGAHAGGLQTYWSTDASTWTGNRVTGITQAVSDAWYDAARAAFYILDIDGRLYKSVNGTTWVDTGTTVPTDNTKTNILACMGGTWCAALSFERLGISVDEGATWKYMPYLFDDAAGDQPYRMIGVQALTFDGRFVVLANPAVTGTKSQAICFSLRLF